MPFAALHAQYHFPGFAWLALRLTVIDPQSGEQLPTTSPSLSWPCSKRDVISATVWEYTRDRPDGALGSCCGFMGLAGGGIADENMKEH